LKAERFACRRSTPKPGDLRVKHRSFSAPDACLVWAWRPRFFWSTRHQRCRLLWRRLPSVTLSVCPPLSLGPSSTYQGKFDFPSL